MSIDLSQDFFTLFGLPRRFETDLAALEKAYLDHQSRVHPDRFAHLSDLEKRHSLQWATRVNEGYRTLRKPLARACYLLELAGIDPGLENNTAMSAEFLMEQMELREALGDATEAEDMAQLDALQQQLRARAQAMHGTLATQFDREADPAAAAETVRRLMFVDKLEREIDDALGALEA